MRSLALDAATGKLVLDNGRARLTTPGAESVGQRLRWRFRLWQGEYGLDTTQGVPYRAFLGRKNVLGSFTRTLRRVAETCPGLARLDTFRVDLNPRTRAATVTLAGRASTGEPVTLDAYALGVL